MKRIVLIFFIFHLFSAASAQTTPCKVLLKSISGKYDGKCENGLANGKGTAKGQDTYTGFFKNGLPEGKGTYIFKNGDTYKGFWKNGLKDGKGKFTFTLNGQQQTLIGYWKEGNYVGKSSPEKPYRVTASSGIMDYKVVKVESGYDNNTVTISIRSAMTNYIPNDLEVNCSTGQVMQQGKSILVSQFSYPLNCDISYSILTGANQRKLCHFIIEITEKGDYQITLSND